MNRCLFLLVLCFLADIPLSAESREPAESNDTIRLDEVVVTGTMPKVNLRNVPMSITVISEERIAERMQPSLLPLLTEEVPGLFISQRGVMGYGCRRNEHTWHWRRTHCRGAGTDRRPSAVHGFDGTSPGRQLPVDDDRTGGGGTGSCICSLRFKCYGRRNQHHHKKTEN